MGKQDVIKHCKTQGHQDKAKSLQSQSRLTFSNPTASDEVLKRTEAEVRMAVLTVTFLWLFMINCRPRLEAFFPTQK